MQISGYKRLLQINAIKQETHGSLCNLKGYRFIFEKHHRLWKTRLLFVKPIASCLIKAGVSLFAYFFKQVNFKPGFIVIDGQSHYGTPEVSIIFC